MSGTTNSKMSVAVEIMPDQPVVECVCVDEVVTNTTDNTTYTIPCTCDPEPTFIHANHTYATKSMQ